MMKVASRRGITSRNMKPLAVLLFLISVMASATDEPEERIFIVCNACNKIFRMSLEEVNKFDSATFISSKGIWEVFSMKCKDHESLEEGKVVMVPIPCNDERFFVRCWYCKSIYRMTLEELNNVPKKKDSYYDKALGTFVAMLHCNSHHHNCAGEGCSMTALRDSAKSWKQQSGNCSELPKGWICFNNNEYCWECVRIRNQAANNRHPAGNKFPFPLTVRPSAPPMNAVTAEGKETCGQSEGEKGAVYPPESSPQYVYALDKVKFETMRSQLESMEREYYELVRKHNELELKWQQPDVKLILETADTSYSGACIGFRNKKRFKYVPGWTAVVKGRSANGKKLRVKFVEINTNINKHAEKYFTAEGKLDTSKTEMDVNPKNVVLKDIEVNNVRLGLQNELQKLMPDKKLKSFNSMFTSKRRRLAASTPMEKLLAEIAEDS